MQTSGSGLDPDSPDSGIRSATPGSSLATSNRSSPDTSGETLPPSVAPHFAHWPPPRIPDLGMSPYLHSPYPTASTPFHPVLFPSRSPYSALGSPTPGHPHHRVFPGLLPPAHLQTPPNPFLPRSLASPSPIGPSAPLTSHDRVSPPAVSPLHSHSTPLYPPPLPPTARSPISPSGAFLKTPSPVLKPSPKPALPSTGVWPPPVRNAQ